MTDQTVAKTILAQLGGNRFVVMTGAKNLTSRSNALLFMLPARMAKNKATYVDITLDGNDTYTVSFFKRNKFDLKLISKHDMIYCDQLRELFTEETGLYTSL
jgi:hypothetical protein